MTHDIDRELLSSLAGGATCIALFDPRERLRHANEAFLRTFNTTLDPAPTWEEMMRRCHREQRGLLIETDDIDTWLAQVRRTYRRVPQRRFESDMSDGRWFSVTETLRADGWVLIEATDVTRFKANEAVLRDARDKAVLISLTDPLTNLYNRRFIFSRLADLLVSARGMRFPLSLAVIDLDHFKLINDRFGHGVGDQVLGTFAGHLRRHLRPLDVVGRIGGEEFLTLLPNSDIAGAQQALARLRSSVDAAPPVGGLVGLQCSFSAGLATAQEDETAEQLYNRADRALYHAKAAGRGRTVVAEAAPPAAAA